METLREVRDSGPDPKTGKSRATSGASFPYYDLADSVEVAEVMHEKATGACDLAQLATLLGYSGVKNGAFRARVSAAKMFGLIEDAEGDQELKLSKRGEAIAAPVTPARADRAKVDAFLDVDLFKKVYDQFHGRDLPKKIGLQNLLRTEFGVVESRISPTIRIMLDSAEHAGFFKLSGGEQTKMVKPVIGADGTGEAEATTDRRDASSDQTGAGNGGRGGGGGGNGSGGDVDPSILGLIQVLPLKGTPMPKKKRDAFIGSFTNLLSYLYPEPEAEE